LIPHFQKVVPGFMAKLLRDFPELDVLDAAAIFGNLGHESKGLTDDQEDKPLAGRGGINWSQWTGPRRKAFEAYCKRAKLDPNSDLAAYKYLWLELKGLEGSEGAALRKTMAAVGLEGKVKAFELAYLRAHKDYKHYPSRLAWANRALEAWQASAKMLEPDPFGEDAPSPDMPAPKPAPVPPAKSAEKKTGIGAGAVVVVLVIAAIAFAVWFIGFRR
jgi:hypothetical protein